MDLNKSIELESNNPLALRLRGEICLKLEKNNDTLSILIIYYKSNHIAHLH